MKKQKENSLESITWSQNVQAKEVNSSTSQARRRGGSRGSNEPPLEVNNGGLKTQTVDFQLLANSGGM